MFDPKDLIGSIIGRLHVIAHGGKDGDKHIYLCHCQCEEGSLVLVKRGDLLKVQKRLNVAGHRGGTSSCGCLRRERSASRQGEAHPNWKGGETARKERQEGRKCEMKEKYKAI